MIDKAALKAAVDAHERRLDTVWSPDRSKEDQARALAQHVEAVKFELPVDVEPAGSEVEAVKFELPPPEAPPLEVLIRLEAIERAIVALTGTRSCAPAAVPEWLQVAAGDPRSYDVPDSARMSVKVRLLPWIYERLEQAHARFGHQTLAGTWECLLRLGLAAAERLPARES